MQVHSSKAVLGSQKNTLPLVYLRCSSQKQDRIPGAPFQKVWMSNKKQCRAPPKARSCQLQKSPNLWCVPSIPGQNKTPLQLHPTESGRQSHTLPALAQLQALQAITRHQCEGALPNQSDGVEHKIEGGARALQAQKQWLQRAASRITPPEWLPNQQGAGVARFAGKNKTPLACARGSLPVWRVPS